MDSNEKPTPLWKKEISFRRKPAARELESGVAPASEPVRESEPAAKSVWKKEISFRKKAEPAVSEPAEAVEPAIVVVEAPEALPGLLPVLEAVMSEPEPEPEPVSAPEIEHSWLTKPLEEVSEPPDLDEVVPELEALDPEIAGELLAEVAEVEAEVSEAASIPELDADLALELPPLTDDELPELLDLLDLPDLPSTIVPELEADAAPVADASPKTPFYKRDLTSKRAPRERKPKAERPRRERAVRLDEPGKPPFYKRELSFKRGPKEWDAAEPLSERSPKSQSRFKLQLTKSEPKPQIESGPKSDSAKEPKATISRPKLRRIPRPKPSFAGGGGGARKLVGLKIGGSQIAAARIDNGASPELVQAVREPLEHGIVVGGELRDPEALAVALKEFFDKHKLPKRGVRLGIANNRIGVRTFEVVGIDDPKQLANAIHFRAQEVLPIPLEEAVLDYQVLSEFVNADGQPVRRVLLVVAYRELVDRYVYACHKAGLQIVGIDLEAFALLRAIAAPHDPVAGSERGALVAVSVGHDRSTFAVSNGRVCEFTRVLEWGGWALNLAIARALDTSPSEAEPIKRALSFMGQMEVPDGFSEDQLTAAREAAKRQLQTFARELVSSLQFYQNQPGSLGIGEIALTGGTAHLPGLGAELERLIGVPVRVADPLARLKMSKKMREQDQVGSLAVAIGLGIDD